MNIVVYEEYDGAIHGNQKYIGILLERISQNYSGIHEMRLVVPEKRELYEKAAHFCDVVSLDRAHWISRVVSLVGVIRRFRPDVILCNNERSVLTVALASLINRVPVVWYVKNLRRAFWSDFICFILAVRVLAIAPECISYKSKYLTKIFHSNIFMQPIGINLDDFESIPMLTEHEGPLRVLLVATVSRIKGVDIALDMMKEMSRKGSVLHLRIAGATPPGSEDFEKKVREEAMSLKHVVIEWLGWRGDIPELLVWADVVILPSRSEGVPRCIVEAMAAGRPVVAASVGGVPSVVDDGITGYLIPQDDVASLVERIETLSSDSELMRNMGRAAREHVLLFYNINGHLRRLLDHLHEATAKL